MKSQSLKGLREQSCGTAIDRMNRYCYDRYSMNIFALRRSLLSNCAKNYEFLSDLLIVKEKCL